MIGKHSDDVNLPDKIPMDLPWNHGHRMAIRQTACNIATKNSIHTFDYMDLGELARQSLQCNQLPDAHYTFALDAIITALWISDYSTVAPSRRLLFVPHGVRQASIRSPTATNHSQDTGVLDTDGLAPLLRRAESLGYQMLVADDAPCDIIDLIIHGNADAVLLLSCLDRPDDHLERLSALGIPHVVVPFVLTHQASISIDCDEMIRLLEVSAPVIPQGYHSYLPIYRLAAHLDVDRLLGPVPSHPELAVIDRMSRTQLTKGGKYLRPFCVLAAYVARHQGWANTPIAEDAQALCPLAVLRLALASECMHKASLAHDDIQDGSGARYGRPAPHAVYGVDLAINLGDHLLGIGYSQVALTKPALGAAAVADILSSLSDAHRDLCLGQGAELLARRDLGRIGPEGVLEIASRKTAPGFSASIEIGLRAAGSPCAYTSIRRFAHHLGLCFQIHDDIQDWNEDETLASADLIAGQPTILSAFAVAAGRGDELVQYQRTLHGLTLATAGHRIYCEINAFRMAYDLADRHRACALSIIREIPEPGVQAFLHFLVRLACPRTAVYAGRAHYQRTTG